MNSKEKMFTERMLGKIEVIKSHIETLFDGAKDNHQKSIAMILDSYDVSFEQLRHENSQELIYRYLSSEHEDVDQNDRIMDLVKRRGLIDPEIIVWIGADEICQVFGLQLKDLNKHVENGQLSILEVGDYKFFDWSEIKELTGSL